MTSTLKRASARTFAVAILIAALLSALAVGQAEAALRRLDGTVPALVAATALGLLANAVAGDSIGLSASQLRAGAASLPEARHPGSFGSSGSSGSSGSGSSGSSGGSDD